MDAAGRFAAPTNDGLVGISAAAQIVDSLYTAQRVALGRTIGKVYLNAAP